MRVIVQRIDGRKLALTELRPESLRIGRGTDAEIRSENPAVALEHAVIEQDENGFVLFDRGSITGTYVNGRAVDSARLGKGDVIEIGDLRIDLQVAEKDKPLFLRIVPRKESPEALPTAPVSAADASASAVELGAQMVAPKINWSDAYRLKRPYLTKLTVAAILLIGTLIVMAEVIRPENHTAFMPGELSSAHRRARDSNGKPVASDCAACHVPWLFVSDAKCSKCHNEGQHSKIVADESRCIECHKEHRGENRLADIGSSVCVDCHGDVGARAIRGSVVRISNRISEFGKDHPPFRPATDQNTLRFNHRLHMAEAGVFNEKGARERLECASCHELIRTSGNVDPKPPSYEAACQRCHSLTFDSRFPDTEAPHGGDPGLIYGFIASTYGGNLSAAGRTPEQMRRLLTNRTSTSVDSRAVIHAENLIKTKCSFCHQIANAGNRLSVVAPELATTWLARADFTHTGHQNVACGHCHSAATSSVETADVLIPAIESCASCHASQAGERGTTRQASECSTCHDYHFSSTRMEMVRSVAR